MKKVFFALFAVVIAVGGSAFTNAKVEVGTTYGSGLNNYAIIPIPYNNLDCTSTDDKTCAYQVTEAGRLIVTEPSYSDAEMATFLSTGKVQVAPGTETGLYDFN